MLVMANHVQSKSKCPFEMVYHALEHIVLFPKKSKMLISYSYIVIAICVATAEDLVKTM